MLNSPRATDANVTWRLRVLAVVSIAMLTACAGSAQPTSSSKLAAKGSPVITTGIEARSGSGFGSYLAGRHAEAVNDLQAAADYMTEALKRDPDSQSLRRRTFLLLLSGGRIEEAAALASRLIENNSKSPIANLVLALEEIRAGATRDAEARLEAIGRRGLNKMLVPLLLVWLRYDQSDAESALPTLDALADDRAFEPIYNLHAGFINDLAGRSEAAISRYQKAVDAGSPPALRAIQALASYHQRTGDSEAARALYQLHLTDHPASGWMEPALARLEAGARADPIVRSTQDGMAEALFGAAGSLYRQGENHMALIFSHLALRLRHDFPIAQILVADIFESLGRVEEAIEAYGRIGDDTIFAWQARLRAATNLIGLERIDEAIERLDRMADERPERFDALFQLGDVLRAEQRYTEAVVAYDRAIERVDDVEPQHWSLLYARGIAFERSKQWTRAEADLLRALELRPEDPFVLNYLGYTWADQGVHLERAQGMIERAAELRPNDGFIVDSLGWVLYRHGNYETAVTHLERAVELQPDDPVINDHLGDAYWRVGRRNEARFQWRRALSLEIDPKLVETIEDKLKNGLQDNDQAARDS